MPVPRDRSPPLWHEQYVVPDPILKREDDDVLDPNRLCVPEREDFTYSSRT